MRNKTHILASTGRGSGEFDRLQTAICGEQGYEGRHNHLRVAGEGEDPTCTKCSALNAKAALEALGDRVKLEPEPNKRGYKFLGRLIVDGQPVAFLTLDEGAFSGYRIRRPMLRMHDGAVIPEASRMGRQGAFMRVRNSKEAAMVAAVELTVSQSPALKVSWRHEGEPEFHEPLVPFDVQLAPQAEQRVENQRRAAKAATKRGEAAQRREDAKAGLIEMRDAAERGDLALTNFQRDALLHAIEAYERGDVILEDA